MKNVNIILHTGEHCIETSAKIEFRRLTDQLLESDSGSIDPELEKKIELLLYFLKNTDFNALRASDERLAGLTAAACILQWDEGGRSLVTVQG